MSIYLTVASPTTLAKPVGLHGWGHRGHTRSVRIGPKAVSPHYTRKVSCYMVTTEHKIAFIMLMFTPRIIKECRQSTNLILEQYMNHARNL